MDGLIKDEVILDGKFFQFLFCLSSGGPGTFRHVHLYQTAFFIPFSTSFQPTCLQSSNVSFYGILHISTSRHLMFYRDKS